MQHRPKPCAVAIVQTDMPVSLIELLGVVFCYLLLAILPLIIIKYVLKQDSKNKDRNQIIAAFIIYPVFWVSWYYLTDWVSDFFGKSIINLYISILLVSIFSFIILLVINRAMCSTKQSC